jgi:hypothetical protein
MTGENIRGLFHECAMLSSIAGSEKAEDGKRDKDSSPVAHPEERQSAKRRWRRGADCR